MSNHIHLIVTPAHERALSAFVKRFAQRYAQYRNRRRDGSGKLYEERFWSEPILSDESLAGHTAYVALNPVVAGIVRTPGQYKWSSYGHYAGERGSTMPAAMMTPSSWYLGLAGDDDARAREYRESIARALVSGHKPDRLPREPLPSGKRLERPNRERAA